MPRKHKQVRRVARPLRLERLEVRLSPAVLSLRVGLGAASVADTGIAASSPDTPQGAAPSVLVEAVASGPTRQGLLRFDSLFGSGPGQIPIGSAITAASLLLWVGQGAGTLAPVELHRMQISWNAATATWNTFNGNGAPGIQTDGVEALSEADGIVSGVSGTGYRMIGGLATALQGWAAGGQNNGWVVTAVGTSSGWMFDTSEGSTPTHRPLLTVQYIPPIVPPMPSYADLAGTPPGPMRADWFAWEANLETQRLNRVPIDRAATFYFAQNGDDVNGTGEVDRPWQTLGKAQSVLNAASGDVHLRFRRGDVWRDSAVLQIARQNVTVDSYGDPGLAFPLFTRFTRVYGTDWTATQDASVWSLAESTPIGWLRLATNPSATVLYRASSVNEVFARRNSWFYDTSAARLYINSALSPNTTAGRMESSLADGQGWTVTSDNVRLADLQIQGAGMSATGAGTGLQVSPGAGGEFVAANVSVTWAGGRGISIVGGGTAATLIGCSSGWLVNRGGTGAPDSGDVTPFDIDSGSGGNEMIMRDCSVLAGALPSADWNGQPGRRHGRYGVFEHNNGPAFPPALAIALRTKYPDSGWQVVGGTSIFGPSVSAIADVRAFIVGESPADGIDSQPGFGSADRVYVNDVYTHLADGQPVSQADALYFGGPFGSWAFNTTVRVDASRLAAASADYVWFQSKAAVDAQFENCRFEIVGVDRRGFDFLSPDAPVGSHFVVRNSILVANGTKAVSLGAALGVGRLDHSAYAFSTSQPGVLTVDPAGVILSAVPLANRVPAPDDDPLFGAGTSSLLDFDQRGLARPANRNDIGPVVGVTPDPANRNRPYAQLPNVGQPPSPDDPAWFDWEARLQSARLANVPLNRTTTYYFAQSGNDLTGDGSATNPFKSMKWANGLVEQSLAVQNLGGNGLAAPDLPVFRPNGKDFTIAFWGAIQNVNRSIAVGKPNSWYLGYLDNQHIGISISQNGVTADAQVLWPNSVDTNWHLFVAGYDAVAHRLRLSIDGAPAVSVASPHDPDPGLQPLTFLTLNSTYTPGRMADAGYWTSAPGGGGSLTDAQAAALFGNGLGRRYEEIPPAMRTNLVSWWKLNELSYVPAYADQLGTAPLSPNGTLVVSLGRSGAVGDLRLRFRGGDTFRDNAGLLIQRSNVTVDSYGQGSAYFNRFNQSFVFGWTHVAGDLWKRTESVPTAWLRPVLSPLGTIYKAERSSATVQNYAYSFFDDFAGAEPNSSGLPTIYLNAGPGINPNTVTGGFEAATSGGGWQVLADNVRLENLKVHGAGLTPVGSTTNDYGLYVSHGGLQNAEFVGVNLEFYFTGYHSIGHIASNSGMATLVGCRAGLSETAVTAGSDAIPFVSYSDNGGQELLMADNEVSFGALPSWDWNAQPGARHGSYGIFQHTAGGPTPPTLSIALRTRFPDNPWQVVNSTRVYSASAANLAAVRAYVIGEAPADGIDSQPGTGLSDCAYVNNTYIRLIHRPNSNTVALYYGIFSSWAINTTLTIDARDWVYTTIGHAIYYGNFSTIDVRLINSRFEVINNNAEPFFLVQQYNTPLGSNFTVQNSILSVRGSQPGSLGPVGAGHIANNAFFSEAPPAVGANAPPGAAPVFLTTPPRDGAPAFFDPLAGAGSPGTLGFDQAGRPRSANRVDIGPWAAAPLPLPVDVRLGNGATRSIPLVAGPLVTHTPINRVTARFDSEVDVGMWSLALTGLDGQALRVGSFSYDPATHTATWMLATPITRGRVRLNLDSTYSVDFRVLMDMR